jgi:hypothetical protein
MISSRYHNACACGAGFPKVARRLDVKMYACSHRATAINYFTGSGLFCRALRYWCWKPSPETAQLAAQHMPGGSCFHLGDSALTVRCSSDDAATILDMGGVTVFLHLFSVLKCFKVEVKVESENMNKCMHFCR